ncbi:MAG: ADP-ribosylglycohydrolase family protein [Spirochaetes bacterium]|nr:ADP-ribosylglycohydrolase family protein [Spirochaetota bacterium]
MDRIIADIIFSSIIGDAAGYTLNGMKKNHINAVFKEINGYVDPSPALKNNMYRWKKAGLYSSISQNILITAACVERNGLNFDKYTGSVQKALDICESEFGIFRDPGEAEKNFFNRIKNGKNEIRQYINPCSRPLPLVIPLLFIKNEQVRFITVINYISLFTRNSSTIVGSILFVEMLKNLIKREGNDILEIALNSAELVKNRLIYYQDIIFSTGYNPDYLILDSDNYFKLFKELYESKDPALYEKIICDYAEKRSTNRITRANINLPDTILPMGVILSKICSDPAKIYKTGAMEGGSASSLTAVSSAVTAAFYGQSIPEEYLNSLINKKRIKNIIDLLTDDKNRDLIIDEIINGEPKLTNKELEEFRAKNKGIAVANKKKRKRADIESEMSKHIVESWTKLDKAKWKKDRKRDKL